MLHYGKDSEELEGSGVDGVGGDPLVLGMLDDGNAGSVSLLLDDSLELDDDGGSGGTVEPLGVGEPLLECVADELLALGDGALLLGSPPSDDDCDDELLDATASLLDTLDELLSLDEDELDDDELKIDELDVGPLLGGSALDDGRLSLLDDSSELDDDMPLEESEVELDGAELHDELPLEDR